MTSNVSATSTTGLYGISGNVSVPNSAQQLLNLLYSNGNVNFSLTGPGTQVQANALVSGGGGTYGNADVAAFLPVYGGPISAGTIFNDSGFAIQGRDYIQMQFTNGVTPPTSEYDIGIGSWIYLDNSGGVFQSNTTGTLKTITLGNDASINADGNITAPYFIGDGSKLTNIAGTSGTYGNANVASYLASNTDPTISNLNANAAVQATQINTLTANAAVQATQINTLTANAATQETEISGLRANIIAANSAIVTVQTNLNSFETYANATFSTGGSSSYGNVNVAAYLSSGVLNSNISTGGNVIAGAVYSNNYFYANGVSIITSGGTTYSNANVQAYLAANTDPTISNLNANAATQQTQINTVTTGLATLNANVGAFETWANAAISSTNANLIAANAAIAATNANLGAFETYANATFSTSSYSNVNAAAYLSSGLISTNIVTTANVNAGNINATGNFYGNLIAANIVVANIGIQSYTTYQTATTPTYSKGVLWYDNASDALAYYNGVTNNTVHIGQETQFQGYNGTGSTITQGTPVYITGGSTGTFPNIAPAQANTLTTTVVAGVANQNIPAASYGYVVTEGTVANVSMGSFTTGDVLYLSPYSAGQVSNSPPPTGYVAVVGVVTYNNSPNGRFLVRITNPTNNQTFGNIIVNGNISGNNASITNKTTTGSLAVTNTATVGNLITTAGVYWANGASYASTVAGTYTNANVLSYLSGGTYGGDIQALSGVITASAINSTGASTATTYVQAGQGLYSIGTFTGSYSDGIVVDYVTGNGRISVGTADNLTFYTGGVAGTQTMQLASNGAAIAGNLITTNGVFWANGTAYSTGSGGGGGSFSGDLAGNILYDSSATNGGRVFSNAYPLSKPPINNSTYKGSNSNNWLINPPVYVSGVLQSPTTQGANQNQNSIAIGLVQSANVTYVGSGQTAQNRQMASALVLGEFWPQTGNSFAVQDRVRGIYAGADLYLTGQTYGYMTANSNSAGSAIIAAVSPFTTINGYGNLTSAIGVGGSVQVIPQTGQTANVLYATGSFSSVSLNSVNSGTGNVQYARLLGGSVTGFSSTLTVMQAIGLHTHSGWAGTVGTASAGAQRAYSVLNEDASTVIQTNGNVVITGNTSLKAYQETVAASGFSGGAWTVNVNNGTIQTATLTSSISSLAFTNMPAGGSVTLIITQGGSGSYTLTTTGIKYAGGSSTLSTSVGAIDILNVFFDGTNYYGSLVKGYA